MKTNHVLMALACCSCILTTNSCTKNNTDLLHTTTVTTENTAAAVNAAAWLWDGDAALGSSKVWKVQNIEGSGSITAVTDPAYGKVWKFDKPSGSHRTEGHGAKGYQSAEGSDIYLGWRSKVVMPVNVTTNAVFQWKAYGSNMQQNFPIVIKSIGGKLRLFHFAPGKIGTELWNTPLTVNAWQSYVLRIKVSRDDTVGFIEFWYNGVPQTLSNGTKRYYARTLDADYCDPKWGIYGADAMAMTNYVGALKIAATYAEAAP
ncbi:polysaccharide lyase [Chitinophaga nivalis]|uniref:Polysaccharide lyase n=1 Tax=Chitinophaga nivalis TaxID=2991709 RepID=A0ABT3IP76_9BACT|nr:polysaccharide lyase [Chitinophaga nivalis]MCW3464533.1 polysaccharide lyase [Chitinophaga nivalis]MCW3485776.1 polysaccharide lyase [Chitinophaga nivalis]